MINIDIEGSGKVEFRGTRATLMMEVTEILRGLKDSHILDDDDIEYIFELEKKSPEELQKEALDIVEKQIDELQSLLNKMAKKNKK